MKAKEAKGRVVITGAATGIGRAICLRLAQEGWAVALNYRTRETEVMALKEEILRGGGVASVAQADITQPEDIRRLFEGFAAQGGVQAMVHAASAKLEEARFLRAQWQSFESQWNVAVRGAYNLAQAFAGQPEAVTPRSMVFLLSTVTLGAPPAEKAAYTTAKYGLLGLVRSLAVELASRNIRVNAISPGFIETPLTAHVDPRIKELIARSTPLKRLGTAEEVAAVAVFLLAPENSYVTGVNLPVAGGSAF